MEDTDKVAQNLQIISTVYKKWLPKLVQQFDDIPYSEALKIQRFKPIIHREIAQYTLKRLTRIWWSRPSESS